MKLNSNKSKQEPPTLFEITTEVPSIKVFFGSAERKDLIVIQDAIYGGKVKLLGHEVPLVIEALQQLHRQNKEDYKQ